MEMKQKQLRKLFAVATALNCDFKSFIANQEERIKFQKKIYAAQRGGFSFGYNYNLYVHGPYCSSLADDGYEIARNLDCFKNNDYSFSAVGRQKIEWAKEFFGNNDDVDWLETITTLDFFYELYSMRGAIEWQQLKQETFNSFIRVKPHLSHDTEKMELAWDKISKFRGNA